MWLSTFTLFVLKIAIDTLFLKIFVVVFRGVFVLFIAIALEILSLPIGCGGRGKSAILANLNKDFEWLSLLCLVGLPNSQSLLIST